MAFDAAVRHKVGAWWVAAQRQQGVFPAEWIAEAARKIAEAA